jgi:hypothetical protein
VIFWPEAKKVVLSFPALLDMAGSLSFLSRNGDDYLDRWDGERWMRTLAASSRNIPFSCRPLGTRDEPRLEVRVGDSRDLAGVREVANLSFLLAGRGSGPC